jgi:type VI protein secretion system component VasA
MILPWDKIYYAGYSLLTNYPAFPANALFQVLSDRKQLQKPRNIFIFV